MANQRNNQDEEEYLNEYYENEFDRLELELDDADMGLVENSALLKAIENSLTTFEEEQVDKPTVLETNDIPTPQYTAKEIADDEKRRERELYGPPSPPRDTLMMAAKIAALMSTVGCPVADASPETTSSIVPAEAAAEPFVPGIKASSHKSQSTGSSTAGVKSGGPGQASQGFSVADVKSADSGRASPGSFAAGVKAADPDQALPSQSADTAGVTSAQTPVPSQALGSPDADEQLVADMVDKIDIDEVEAPTFGGAALMQNSSSLVGSVAASGVAHDSDASSHAGQHFDDMVARAHQARVAAIEAALKNPNADLEATVRAGRASHIIRRAPVAAPARAAGGQASTAGGSLQEAGQPDHDMELE